METTVQNKTYGVVSSNHSDDKVMVFLRSEMVKEETVVHRKKGKIGEEDRTEGGGDMKKGKICDEDRRGGGEDSRRGEESS